MMGETEVTYKEMLDEKIYKPFGKRRITLEEVYSHLLSLAKKRGCPLDKSFVYMSLAGRFRITSSTIKRLLWILKRLGFITYYGKKVWLVLPTQNHVQKTLMNFEGESNANDKS